MCEEIEIIERPLMQHVLEHFARSDVAGHRDVEPGLEILEGVGHRRKQVRRTAERLSDVLADVPDADRHDVPRMRLPQDDGRGLPPLPDQCLADREARRVVTPTDARVRRPALESLVIPEHYDVATQRIPKRVRIPRFNQLVPPRTRDHYHEEAVVEADRLVHPDLVDQWERLDSVAEFLPDRVVDRGDRPSRRHELAVLLDPERAHAEGPLNLRDRRAPFEQVDDGLFGPKVRVRKRPVQVSVDLQCTEIETAQRCGRPERLDVVVEDDPAVGLSRESDFDVRRRGPQGELARLIDDATAAVHILHMDAVHPADQLRPEVDDVLHWMPDPFLGGIEDLRVAVDRRNERPDVHLRIAESADEDAGRGRPVHVDPIDHRGGLHHRVPADEDRAARLAAEEFCAPALDAQAARDAVRVSASKIAANEAGAGWTGRESIAAFPTEEALKKMAPRWANRSREGLSVPRGVPGP